MESHRIWACIFLLYGLINAGVEKRSSGQSIILHIAQLQ